MTKVARRMMPRTYLTLAHVPKSAQTDIGRDEQPEAGSSAQIETCHEAVPQAAFYAEPTSGPEHSAQHEEGSRSEALPSASDNGAAAQMTLPDDAASFAARADAAIAKCVGVQPSFLHSLNQTGQTLAPASLVMLLMKHGGDSVIDAVIGTQSFPRRSLRRE
jgi:hypothetical protein